MSVLNIFDNDAFNMTSMLGTVDNFDFKPSLLGSMGVFTNTPVRTESIAIESREDSLGLIQTSQRGAPLDQLEHGKRKIRNFSTVRLAEGDRILASELQFLREHGTEDQVVQLQIEIARRMTGPGGLIDRIDYTMENLRLGAVQGLVKDADGSTLIDWYQELGVTAEAEIGFDLANLVDGELREKCNQLTRSMAKAAKGAWRAGARIQALCGDQFFDTLGKVKEVRDRDMNAENALYVNGADAYGTIVYGGVTWVNYHGSDDGTSVGVDTDKVIFFPSGVDGLFLEVFSPGEEFGHLGKLGQEIYPGIVRDVQRDRYVDLEATTYPLHVCTRPQVLRKGRAGA